MGRSIRKQDRSVESVGTSVTRLRDILEFGQLFKAFGNN